MPAVLSMIFFIRLFPRINRIERKHCLIFFWDSDWPENSCSVWPQRLDPQMFLTTKKVRQNIEKVRQNIKKVRQNIKKSSTKYQKSSTKYWKSSTKCRKSSTGFKLVRFRKLDRFKRNVSQVPKSALAQKLKVFKWAIQLIISLTIAASLVRLG